MIYIQWEMLYLIINGVNGVHGFPIEAKESHIHTHAHL